MQGVNFAEKTMTIRFTSLLFPIFGLLPVGAQVVVERFFSVQTNIADYGQYVDVRTISQTGLTSISDVDARIVMRSASGDTMRLGDYFVSLTYGTASEDERVAVLLNRPRATDVRQWGSSLSSADFVFDDSQNATNVFYATTTTGTFAADGRLSVNPYATAQAYDASAVTNGLSALNGQMLSSDRWSLLVADTRQGAAGYLDSWSLKITGDTMLGGSLDPGAGGIIYDKSDGVSEVLANLVVAGTGNNRVTADVSTNLVLSGGLSGSGELFKRGSGKLEIGGDSSAFSGKITVQGGDIKIMSNAVLGPNSNLLLDGVASKVILASGSSIATTVTLGNDAVVSFDGAGMISGPITGAGKLIKEGTGAIELTGNNSYAGPTIIRSGVLQLGNGGSGGSISVNSAIVNDSALVINQSDIVRQGVDFTGEIITGSGSFTTSGTGTTILTANNAYTGDTNISSGADLRINGNHTGAGAVTVSSDAKLGGSGSVIGNINVSGVLSPGNSIESFGSGSLTFAPGSTYVYEIDTSLINADLMYSSGLLNIADGAILTLSDVSTISVQIIGAKFTLISTAGAWNGGLFQYDSGLGLATVADDSIIRYGSNSWLINYNDTSPGSNYLNDTIGATNFVTMTAIPELQATSLLALGCCIPLLLRRRYQQPDDGNP